MDWNKAIAYGQLVNAAYDVVAGEAPATGGYEVVATIYANDLATDASRQRGQPVATVAIGLILQAQASGDVVIAIRGTEGIKEWVQDAKFLMRQFTPVAGAGETEDGFTDVYRSMKVGEGAEAATVVKWLGEHQWRRPTTSLTICGHSLGGALATLLALDVAANAEVAFQNPIVYTSRARGRETSSSSRSTTNWWRRRTVLWTTRTSCRNCRAIRLTSTLVRPSKWIRSR